MSFVGPRPERPFFVEQYLGEVTGYRERFNVKPGITGLAQVERQLRHHPRTQAQVRPHLHLPPDSRHGHPDSRRDPSCGADRTGCQVAQAYGRSAQAPAWPAAFPGGRSSSWSSWSP